MSDQANINKIRERRDAKIKAEKAKYEAHVAEARKKKALTDADLDKMGGTEAPRKSMRDRAASRRTAVAPKVTIPKATPTTIAQDVANVKVELPKGPLQGQGSMADKPVQQTVVKVPDAAASKVTPDAVKAWKAGQDADRRVRESKVAVDRRAAAPKVMTAEGKVESTAAKVEEVGEAAFKRHATPMSTKLANQLKIHETKAAYKAPIVKLAEGAASRSGNLAKRAATSVARGTKDFVVGELKALDPTGPYRELVKTAGKSRTSRQVAGALIKGSWGAGKRLVRDSVASIGVQYAFDKGFEVGTEAAKTQLGTERAMTRHRSQGAKYGLKVTGGDEGFTAMGKAALRAATFGQVDLGKDIQVREDPQLKAAFIERNKKRIQKMQYDELKAKANRNVQRGGGAS